MFNLFALLYDPSDCIDNDSLMHDLEQKLLWIGQYAVCTEQLDFPDVTLVVLEKEGWRVEFEIREQDSMTLSLGALQKILKKKTALPENFLSYNKELAIGFGDDPDRRFTDEIIQIGEFVRENYPGVVIYDQYNEDVW
ncbi:hypothetical protein CK621_07985 [Vandammella animalimorsus]|uniref:Uncharacterized protein n=2 Tax=Vandammella animalimorsus TaxID=2029117 RepID=A0A2A2AXZ3_9BURK|nr:hypothetical protein CK621_07985 [Vandammella animalimorsus]